MGEVVAAAQGKSLESVRRLRPRRRAPPRQHRLRVAARRRHRRRPHGALRRHRRADRDHPPLDQPRHLCRGQPARGPLRPRQEVGPVRHGRGARAHVCRHEDNPSHDDDRLRALLVAGRPHHAQRRGPAPADVDQRLGRHPLEGLAAAPRQRRPAARSAGVLGGALARRRPRPARRVRSRERAAPARRRGGDDAARRHARGARPCRLAADPAPARRAAPRRRPAPVRPGAARLDRQHGPLHRPVRHRLGHLPRAAQHLHGRRDHDRARLGPGRRSAGDDGGRPGRRDPGGARLQRLRQARRRERGRARGVRPRPARDDGERRRPRAPAAPAPAGVSAVPAARRRPAGRPERRAAPWPSVGSNAIPAPSR